MRASPPRTRRVLLAVLAGVLLGAVGVHQGRALPGPPGAGADLRFVLGAEPGSLSRAIVTLEHPARAVSLRVEGAWVGCLVDGLEATCPLPHRLRAENLRRVDLVASG
jgi:hypothetical protein